jgi:hypothetical protein
MIQWTNKVKKKKEQEEIEKNPKGLVISPRCHQKIRNAYCESCHVLGEKNCRGWVRLMAQGREFRTSGKKRKRERGRGGRLLDVEDF